MGEVVPARTSPTLHLPSPPTVHQLSRLKVPLIFNKSRFSLPVKLPTPTLSFFSTLEKKVFKININAHDMAGVNTNNPKLKFPRFFKTHLKRKKKKNFCTDLVEADQVLDAKLYNLLSIQNIIFHLPKNEPSPSAGLIGSKALCASSERRVNTKKCLVDDRCKEERVNEGQ